MHNSFFTLKIQNLVELRKKTEIDFNVSCSQSKIHIICMLLSQKPLVKFACNQYVYLN